MGNSKSKPTLGHEKPILDEGVFAPPSNGRTDYGSASSSQSGGSDGLNMSGPLSLTRVREFSSQEIMKMTKQRREKIGSGGFGPVYKGVIKSSDRTQWVAVKFLSENSSQGLRELVQEIKVLPNIHHRHLVSLIGFCNDDTCQGVVYEYVPNGTLSDHLHPKNGDASFTPLPWRKRLTIALEIALALSYLHLGITPAIIHRDIKPSNVLLDFKMHAKLGDFGLSRLFANEEYTHLTTGIKGTLGYLDPEYHRTQRMTEKTDVYSFGVLLMEMISAKKPVGIIAATGKMFNLVDWARGAMQRGNIKSVMDKRIKEERYCESALWKLADGAMMCCEPHPANRPGMAVITQMIREAIMLEEQGSGRAEGVSQRPPHGQPPSGQGESAGNLGPDRPPEGGGGGGGGGGRQGSGDGFPSSPGREQGQNPPPWGGYAPGPGLHRTPSAGSGSYGGGENSGAVGIILGEGSNRPSYAQAGKPEGIAGGGGGGGSGDGFPSSPGRVHGQQTPHSGGYTSVLHPTLSGGSGSYGGGESSVAVGINQGEWSSRPSYGDNSIAVGINQGGGSNRPSYGDNSVAVGINQGGGSNRPSYGENSVAVGINQGGGSSRPSYVQAGKPEGIAGGGGGGGSGDGLPHSPGRAQGLQPPHSGGYTSGLHPLSGGSGSYGGGENAVNGPWCPTRISPQCLVDIGSKILNELSLQPGRPVPDRPVWGPYSWQQEGATSLARTDGEGGGGGGGGGVFPLPTKLEWPAEQANGYYRVEPAAGVVGGGLGPRVQHSPSSGSLFPVQDPARRVEVHHSPYPNGFERIGSGVVGGGGRGGERVPAPVSLPSITSPPFHLGVNPRPPPFAPPSSYPQQGGPNLPYQPPVLPFSRRPVN